jgi:predicted RNA-binding protein
MSSIAGRNFIRFNIENIKGNRKAVSIEKEPFKVSPPKHHYGISKNNQNMNQRISDLEKKLYQVENNYQQEIIEQLSTIKEDIRMIKSHIFDQKYRST